LHKARDRIAAGAVFHYIKLNTRKLPFIVEASQDAEFLVGATNWAEDAGDRKRAHRSAQPNP
jgi:hypothetical protein